MISPDNYVQSPLDPLNYDRYGYARNNPLVYTDKDGNFFWLIPVAIGAVMGGYSGYKIGEANGATGWNMFGYIAGGAAIGAASDYVGASIATGGGFMANTMGIVASSAMNSMGMSMLSGGQIAPSVSFGVASFDFGTGEWDYLGKKGNSFTENVGYGLGALANVSDVLAGFKPGSVELRTENDPGYSKEVDAQGNPIPHKDLIGHSQLNLEGKVVIDWGPTKAVSGFGDWVPGTNSYENGQLIPASKMKWDPFKITGVNVERIKQYSTYLSKGGNYNLAFNSCVSMTSRALNMSGVFNIGIHPYILNAQMYLRSIGIRPFLYSYMLY